MKKEPMKRTEASRSPILSVETRPRLQRSVKPVVLSRRRVLQGLLGTSAVALGLPPLDSMFNRNGDAYADNTEIPTRYGVWYWGCGVRPERFRPKTPGKDWEVTEELAPLAHLRDDLTIVSGLDVKVKAVSHFKGRSAMTCGGHFDGKSVFEPTFGTPAGMSTDQIAAKHWEGQTLLRSLEVGVSIVGGNHTKQGVGTTSWNGPDDLNPAIFNPSELYDKLFAGNVPAEQRAAMNLARMSMLDAVKGDTAGLLPKLGQTDRTRLESHLEGFRELERQIQFYQAACEAPERPGVFVEDRNHELLEEKNLVLANLTKIALACNMTRAFTYQYAQFQMNTIFWQVGATEGMHIMTHDDRNLPPEQTLEPQPETIHKAVVYIMGHFAVFLDALKSVPEGAGTLLDHSLVLATTDVTEGTSHSEVSLPILIGGGASGRFAKGQHYVYSGNDNNTTRILLTALNAVGVPTESMGSGDGFANQPLSDLLIA